MFLFVRNGKPLILRRQRSGTTWSFYYLQLALHLPLLLRSTRKHLSFIRKLKLIKHKFLLNRHEYLPIFVDSVNLVHALLEVEKQVIAHGYLVQILFPKVLYRCGFLAMIERRWRNRLLPMTDTVYTMDQ
jgi:hypothetical protein